MSERSYQKRSTREWMTLIERQARSGLSQAAFCRSEAVPLSTFQYWKRRLRDGGRPGATAEAPLFTSLGALPPTEPADDEPAEEGGWTLDLDLGGGLRLTLRKVA
jgi:putative component of toxin-antitoxin plasmid stabilization module